MAPPSPPLPEELVEEILLLFPPDEPACLFRASLVCKPWCRLISGPGFRRRYREFHRTPPILGFLCGILAGVETARFVPTSSFCSPLDDLRECCAIDARHGRVLLRCPGKASSENDLVVGDPIRVLLRRTGKASSESVLVVWDPISNERRELPIPTRWRHASRWNWNAAVLCAADGPCDHLDCHRGPFLVVSVDSYFPLETFISTYSSDTGTWTDRIFPQLPLDYISISLSPCAHAGNALYFLSQTSNKALKYDFCLYEISVIRLPPASTRWEPLVLTGTEDGGLGCATMHEFKLYMWSRKDDGPRVDDAGCGWTQNRVIDLEMLLCSNAILTTPHLAAFANGIGVVFLRAWDMIFTVDLKTKNLKKVPKGKMAFNILPYMSFYTPELRAARRFLGPSAGGSSASK